MPSVITVPIGQSSFELVRNRIGEILIDELAAQHTLSPIAGVTSAKVYIERFRSFDNVELPSVNVTIDADSFGHRTAVSGDGTVTYNIDCYTSAPTTSAIAGDTSAMARLHRLLGICRAILMDSRYIKLGFTAPFVMSRAVTQMQLSKPVEATDGLSLVMGRLVMTVRVPEQVSQDTLLEIAGYDTQVKLGLTEKGYIFSGDNIPVPPITGSEIAINGTFYFDLTCGDQLNIPVLNSGGDAVGTVSQGVGVEVSDGTVDVVNSDGDALASVSVPAEGLVEYIAPDAEVLVTNSDGDPIATVTVPSGGTVPYTAPDGTYRLVNTNNSVIQNGSVASGEINQIITAPDAEARVFDSAGNPISITQIASNDFQNITAPDGAVTFNGTGMLGVRSNGSSNYNVLQSGSPVGSRVGDDWVVPPCSAPALAVSSSNATPAYGSNVTLTATATGFTPTSYIWTINDAIIGTGSPLVYTVLQAGAVTVRCMATDGVNYAWGVTTINTADDADAAAYLTATGLSSDLWRQGVNRYIYDLKAGGVWATRRTINLLFTGNATSNRYNLINPQLTTGAHVLTFYGGWTHGAQGIVGNGTNSYAQWALNPNTLGLNVNSHAFGIVRMDNSANNGYDICLSNTQSFIICRYTGDYYGSVHPALGRSIVGTIDGRGDYVTSRTSSTLIRCFKDGLNIFQNTGSNAAGFVNDNYYLGGGASGAGFTSARFAIAHIGDGMTDAQVVAMRAANARLLTTMGINYSTS
jgi:hypothetical protein